MPNTRPRWSDVAIKGETWTSLIHIIKYILSELNCVMLQQMIEARLVKKKGETLKHATKRIEQFKKRLQGQERDHQQQQEIQECFENMMLSEEKSNKILFPKAPPLEWRESEAVKGELFVLKYLLLRCLHQQA